MKTSQLRRLASLLSGVLVLVAAVLAHAESAMSRKALEFAAKHNLPVRKVMAPGSGKPVERLFVPVMREHYDEFKSNLIETNGGIGIRALSQKMDVNGHIAIQIEPGSNYLWAKNQAGNASYNQYMNQHDRGGYLFGVDLNDAEIKHMKTQIASIPHNPSNCMMWLSEAEIAPGKLLFHALGVTRSKGAGNSIRQKLLRVSNDRLLVAGVMVNNLDEFNRMTEAELLGPPHQNGDAEAAHAD